MCGSSELDGENGDVAVDFEADDGNVDCGGATMHETVSASVRAFRLVASHGGEATVATVRVGVRTMRRSSYLIGANGVSGANGADGDDEVIAEFGVGGANGAGGAFDATGAFFVGDV